jgi:tetratricopeptide (TPR) repeat protein/serine phosphatase RsbU (regulator of sigma subunit)
MRQFTRIILAIIFSLLNLPGYSQEISLSEMIGKVNNMKDDTVKVNVLIDICDSIYNHKPSETIEYALKALEISEKNDFTKGAAYAYKYIGMGYYQQSDYVKAIEYFQFSLDIFESIRYQKGISNMLNSLGVIYNYQRMDAKALEMYLKSLRIAEAINDPLRYVTALTNVGYLYSKMALVDKAKEYYDKALVIAEENGLMQAIGTLTVNLGDLYFDKGENKEALVNYEKSLSALRKTNTGNIPYSLLAIGKTYARMGDYEKSIRYLEESYSLASQSNGKKDMAAALIGIANTNLDRGEFQKAIDNFQKAEPIAYEINDFNQVRESYDGLAKAYAKRYDFFNAFQYQKKESNIKDTLFSGTTRSQINQFRIQIEVDSMSKVNEILKRDAQFQESKNRSQIMTIILLVVFLSLISLFAILLIRANNNKKKTNDELNSTNEELNNTLDIVNSQKKLIETAHTEITASINYAKYIQSSVLPKASQIESCLGEHFIFYKPKEIVSGDFYWCSGIDNLSVFAAVDCTGHGVPGAFMSMIATALLNEIVTKEHITNPAEILQRLRTDVIDSLQQQGETGEIKDGMDLSLCVIDFNTMKLQFAGANNSMYVVRKKDGNCIADTKMVSSDEYSLYELKGDRMPVSIHVSMENFTMFEFDLEQDDILYLFSDGYADQFGGQNSKKMQYKNFKKILLKHCSETMINQKTSIENEFYNWKGSNSQLDDILVAGIRIEQRQIL